MQISEVKTFLDLLKYVFQRKTRSRFDDQFGNIKKVRVLG